MDISQKTRENKTLIYIPTKNRVEILKKNTFPWVLLVKHADVCFTIEPQDMDQYSFLPPENVLPLEENDQGLGYANEVVKRFAGEKGYEYIFKIDDDVKGFTQWRKVLATSEEIAEHVDAVIEEAENSFKEHENLKAITFPYSFQLFEEKDWELTKRVQTAYIVRTGDYYATKDLSVFEDFAVGISILVKGGKIALNTRVGIDLGVPVGGGTGGHQSFDRYKRSVEDAFKLRKLYPPLRFKKVDKKGWAIEPDLRSIDL